MQTIYIFKFLGSVTLGGDQLDNIELLIGIEASTRTVFITMTGPTAQWFAVGFGSHSMEDTYSIVILWTPEPIIEITDSEIEEYQLGYQNSGINMTKFVQKKIQYNEPQFRRTVLMERPTFKIGDSALQYFNFSICNKDYPIIWSRGEYHASQQQTFGINAHARNDRGRGTIRVEGTGFVECDSTQSILNEMHFCIVILISCIVIVGFY